MENLDGSVALNSKTRDIARECLDKVGLSDYQDRQIGQLSGGQQQRVFLLGL